MGGNGVCESVCKKGQRSAGLSSITSLTSVCIRKGEKTDKEAATGSCWGKPLPNRSPVQKLF